MGNAPSTPETSPTIATETEAQTPTPPLRLLRSRTTTDPHSSAFRPRPFSTTWLPDEFSAPDTFDRYPAEVRPSLRSYQSTPAVALDIPPVAEFDSPDVMAPANAGLDPKSAAILRSVVKKSSMSTIQSLIEDPSSASHDTSDIDVNAAVAILRELKKRASPEDLIALHKALLPSRDDAAELTSSPSKATVSDHNTSPLIRRSSLMPPGVATRTKSSSVVAKVMGSKSSREQVKKSRPLSDQFFTRPAGTKITSKQASGLGLHGDGLLIRSNTPADLDITHTGSYAPGTLHITNGAVSPEPSIRSTVARSPVSPINKADDYFTAEEGSLRSDSMTNTSNDGLSVRDQILRSAAVRRSSELTIPRVLQPPKVNIKSAIPGLAIYDDSSDEEEEQKEEEVRPSSQQTPRSVDKRPASAIAEDYTSECQLPSGPYVHHRNLSNGSFVSRLSTVLDQDENSNVGEIGGKRDDALRRLNGAPIVKSNRYYAGSRPSTSGSPQPSDRLEVQHRPSTVSQSDSGYGSELPPQSRETLVQYSDDDEPFHSAQDHLHLHSQLQTPTERKDGRPATLASLGNMFGSSAAVDKGLATMSEESLPPTEEQKSNRHLSMPNIIQRPSPSSSASSTTVRSVSTTMTDNSNPEKGGKQRKRLYKPPPHNQAQPQPQPQAQEPSRHRSKSFGSIHRPKLFTTVTVPNVPDEMSVNFSRRMIRTPAMGHLENTFEGTSSTTPWIETAPNSPKTPQSAKVDNRGSSLWTRTPTTPQSASSDARGREPAEDSQPSSVEPISIKKRRSIFRLRGRSRSKSLAQSVPETPPPLPRGDNIPTVSDTVPQYHDFTTPQITTAVLEYSPVKMRTGHLARYNSQGGDSAPASPMPKVGMDEETASRFARRKSKDAATAALKEAERSRSRPRAERRPEPDATERSRSRPAAPHHISELARPASRRSSSAHADKVDRPIEAFDLRNVNTSARSGQENRPRSKSVSPRMRNAIDGDSLDRISSPPVPKLPAEHCNSPVESPTHGASHPGWPGWEKQQALWRERRMTLNDALPRKTSDGYQIARKPHPEIRDPTRNSPSIVVSRYVTPSSADHAARLAGADSATRSRILENATHSLEGTNQDENRPAKSDVPRTDSAISNSTFRTAASTISRGSTPLTNVSPNARREGAENTTYRPYRASDEVTLNRLTSSPARTQRPAADSEHQMLMGREGTPGPGGMYDRFSGGLDYGWERGVGFNGSAGTRPSERKSLASRKSAVLSENFGVDLSDIPVFLTRAT